MKRLLIFREMPTTHRYWTAATRELEARGWDVVHVFTRGTQGGEGFALGAGSSRDYPSVVRDLGHLLDDLKPQVLHASEPIQAAIAARAVNGEVPVVFQRHHVRAKPKQMLISKIAERKVAGVIAVSDAVARRVADGVVVSRAYNGVDPIRKDARSDLTEKWVSDGRPVVVCVARLSVEKGQRDLAAAWPQVKAACPEAILVLVGAGPDDSRLRRVLGPDVAMVGHQAQVDAWFTLASVVVVPSRWEGFGLAAVEAMAAAKPVVATRAGGLPEVVVDGETGLLIEVRRPEAMAQAIVSLLQDEDLRRSLGEQGKARHERFFTPDLMVKGWEAMYDKVSDGG